MYLSVYLCVCVREGMRGTLTMAAERSTGAVQGIAGLGGSAGAAPSPPYKAPPLPAPSARPRRLRAGTGRDGRPGLPRATAPQRGALGRPWGAGGEAECCCSITHPAVTADGARSPLLESTLLGRFDSLPGHFGGTQGH